MTNKPEVVLPEPKFGEWLRGIYASERNPIRDGMYVRTIRLTGKFNRGKFYELTDGKGKFWMYPVESTQRIAPPADTLTRPADGDFVMVPRSELERVIHELRTYNPIADEYKGVHIHSVWARELERLSAAPQQGGKEVGDRDAYEGAREDLLDWKGRALRAEAELRWLGYTGIVPDQQPAEVVAWSVLQIGHHGAAYDPPNAKRAYTYDHQPDNIGAYRLGRAAGNVPQRAMGDNIDYGLVLLKCLQEEGYGVFQIGPSLPPPAIDIGKLRELVARWRNDAKCQVIRVMAKQQLANADQLAALIGDGGEVGNG